MIRATDKQFNKMSVIEPKVKGIMGWRLFHGHTSVKALQEEEVKFKEELKKLEIQIDELRQSVTSSVKGNDKIWVPKVIAIISRYPYYDYFNMILENLVDKICNPDGINQRLLEHTIFSIVWKIPSPRPT